jgi:uncharacterized protein (TIGR03437 family)
VTKLLASTGALVGTYPVGANPLGVTFGGASIWVANDGSNNVTELLASTGTLVDTYTAGTHPDSIAFDGANIWVANFYDNTVTEINPAVQNTATLSVTNLAFGSQVVGLTSAPKSVTVTNSGTAALNITGISITGTNSADYFETNTCDSSVAAGSSCVISVTFTPTVAGTRTASISIFDNAGNSPQTVSLTGTGQASAVATPTLSATVLTFGSQVVGLGSAPQSVTVTNSGTAALNITGISITGTNSADYTETNTCGSSVAAGSSCVISVTFTPTVTGTRTASISIFDNAGNSPQTVSLTGTGQASTSPVISSVTYPVGIVPLGIAFDGTNVWVTNDGSATVTKLRASTGATVGTYSVGINPDGIAFDGVNIWVANRTDGTVTKLLASTGATVGIYPVGITPYSVVFEGADIWVTTQLDNSVAKLLASTGAVVGTYPAGPAPYGIAFDGANVWVANIGSGTVTKLLASSGATVGTYPAGPSGSCPIGLAFDGANIWVANACNNSVTKLLASTGAMVGSYSVGTQPYNLAFDGVNIWVTNQGSNTVTELLASTGATVGTYPVGKQPSGVAFDGANIWVVNQGDNTVTKIIPAPQAPSILPAGIVPLDSTASTIQPGEWVSIWGSNLASGTTVWGGNFPTSLGGTSVKINGKAAYLSLVSPGQINLQAPDDPATGTVPVLVTTANGSATSTVTLGEFAPSFALLDSTHVAGIIPKSDGSGAYGGGTYDILGPTGSSLGYPTVAAKAGDTVELYGVGFGPTNRTVPAGQAFSGAAPTTNPVSLLINNVSVTPTFAGLSGAGLYQINLTIPGGIGTGDVSLQATVGGVQTQSGVVISLVGAQPTGLTGYWTFTAQSSVYGFQSGASGQLTQSGNNISGQLNLSGTPCATSAIVSGTISGSSLSMSLNENGQLVTFSGSVSSNNNSASGTYVAPPGGCTNGDSGTWAGTRQ